MANAARAIRSVLFVCNMNSIRSPMGAALLRARAPGLRVDSAGVYEGALDPFVEGILAETMTPLAPYEPKAMDDVDVSAFDLAIAMTPEAAGAARRLMPADRVEFWSIDNPTDVRGDDAALFAAYRAARDDLAAKIDARFADFIEKS